MQTTQSYIVKQPIHDENSQIFAYEVMYVEEEASLGPVGDTASAGAIESLLTQFESDGFLEGKTAFIHFTPNLLYRNVPKIFAADKLVIQIDEEVLLIPLALKLISKYRKENYKVALRDFEFNSRYLGAIDSVDMIKLNFSGGRIDSHESITEVATRLGKTIIAYNVNDEASFKAAKELGIKYMQGSYLSTVLPEKVHHMNHLQSNFFQLMIAVNKEDIDFDEIEQLVARDVTLTYALFRLVNSAYFALRNKVESVHQALVILGIGQLRQWIYLMSFQPDANIPSEFIKISFMRANFCAELLPLGRDIPISKSEAYLMGMFSTLGSLMDIPLEQALRELNISEHVVEALVQGTGRAGLLFNLVLAYEQGNWIAMSNNAEELGIPVHVISQKYFECMDMVNQIWTMLAAATTEEGK